MTLDVRATSFARAPSGEDVAGVVVIRPSPDGRPSSSGYLIITEAEAIELLDRLMTLLRVPGWVQKIVRTFARGLLK